MTRPSGDDQGRRDRGQAFSSSGEAQSVGGGPGYVHGGPAQRLGEHLLCFLAARREAPGRVVHVSGRRVVVPLDAAGAALAALLADGPVDVELSPDFLTAAWRKLLTNVAANPVTALTGRPLGVLGSPGIPALVRGLLTEAVAAGAAAGARLSAADVADTLGFYARFDAGAGTSMLEDRLAGRPTEHQEITGAVVRAADRHGVNVPSTARCSPCWPRPARN